MQNTAKRNYTGSVAFYDIRSGNEMGLFYNAPEERTGGFSVSRTIVCSELTQMTMTERC